MHGNSSSVKVAKHAVRPWARVSSPVHKLATGWWVSFSQGRPMLKNRKVSKENYTFFTQRMLSSQKAIWWKTTFNVFGLSGNRPELLTQNSESASGWASQQQILDICVHQSRIMHRLNLFLSAVAFPCISSLLPVIPGDGQWWLWFLQTHRPENCCQVFSQPLAYLHCSDSCT